MYPGLAFSIQYSQHSTSGFPQLSKVILWAIRGSYINNIALLPNTQECARNSTNKPSYTKEWLNHSQGVNQPISK